MSERNKGPKSPTRRSFLKKVAPVVALAASGGVIGPVFNVKTTLTEGEKQEVDNQAVQNMARDMELPEDKVKKIIGSYEEYRERAKKTYLDGQNKNVNTLRGVEEGAGVAAILGTALVLQQARWEHRERKAAQQEEGGHEKDNPSPSR